MTDTAAPTPSHAPSTPVPAVPVAPIAPTLKPGYATSEAWLTFLAMLIGAIPSSGLVANAPLAAKLVGMAIAALAALGYTTNRTNLKRAHVAIGNLPASLPANSNKASTATTAAAAVLLSILVGVGSTQSATAAPVATAPHAIIGLQCTAQDLRLVKTTSDDLVGVDYANAIDKLIASSGNTATGCAVLTVHAVARAGKTSGAAAFSPIELRASEMIDKYHWVATEAAGGTK